ncbi:MAG: hypothetical protein QNK37_17240 [Acidobacteriota bacterium]|nr:hypothetical protein [Acidobacteriota bacterium]
MFHRAITGLVGPVLALTWIFQLQAGDLPEGIDPLPPSKDAALSGLIEEAVRYRGLPLKQSVPSGQLDEARLKGQFASAFHQEMPDDVLGPVEKVLKTFGMLPESMDMSTYLPELLSSQVAGYYDPAQKYLVLVEREWSESGEQDQKMNQLMDEAILVHEINHAIQDQHFDLGQFGMEQPLSDEAAARLALVEGDATVVMYGYMLGVAMERIPGADMGLKMTMDEPEMLLALAPDMPGGKELIEAPAYLRETMMFSYIQGAYFCIQVRKAGGQKLLDHAFQNDPPRSTEQIMHPEKWLTERDDPVTLTIPSLTKPLRGYRRTAEGTLGELEIRLLLTERLSDEQRNEAREAAAGWGGDRFVLYEKGRRSALAWVTEWDTSEDKQQFLAAARKALPDWDIEDSGSTRVTLVKTRAKKKRVKRVLAELAGIQAVRGANLAPDLAALGITQADKPATLTAAESMKLMENPLLNVFDDEQPSDGLQASQLSDMLKNPEAREMINQLGREMLGDAAGDVDFAAILENPEVMKMVESMMQGGQNDAEGKIIDGTYTNDGLGIAVSLPKKPGWVISDDKPSIPMGPKALIQFTDMHSGSNVLVLIQNLPMAMPVESLLANLEMGIKSQFSDYEKLKGRHLKEAGKEGYQMEYTGSMSGQGLHFLHRFHMMEGKLLMLVGTATEQAWHSQQEAIREALDSLKFLEKTEME